MAIYLNGIKVAGRGISGKSPYEIAKEGGYTGTESAFNAQLVAIGDASKGFQELQDQVESTQEQIESIASTAINNVNSAIADIDTTVSTATNEINTIVANAKTEIDEKVEQGLAEIPSGDTIVTKAELEEKLSEIVTDIWYYGDSAPSNTKLFWIDSDSTSGGLKYYNGTSWVHVPVAWT